MSQKSFFTLFFGILSIFFVASCNQQNKSDNQNNLTGDARVDAATIVEQASLAMQTALKKAIKDGDLVSAVHYCNLNAYPITDSVSQYYGIKLKRTSLKLRNIANEPDSIELELLKSLQKVAFAGANPSPMILDIDEKYYRYVHPIIMQPICLNCHGVMERGDIAKVTQKAINERYPLDKAYNFNNNELRGAWMVLLPKNLENQ